MEDDFDLESEGQDTGQRSMIAMLVIMGLVMVWSFLLAPGMAPSESEKAEARKPGSPTAAAKGTEQGRADSLAPAPKATTGSQAQGPPVEPAPPAPEAAEPPRPLPELAPELVERRSRLLCATFSSEDASLARLVLLDHFRTPIAKREARRAQRHDPEADVAPYGLPLLGQEARSILENGGFEEGAEKVAEGQEPKFPRRWVPAPHKELGSGLLWATEAHSGRKSIAIKDPAEGCGWHASVSAGVAEATYEVVCWVRVEPAAGTPDDRLPTLRIEQRDADGREVVAKDAAGRPRPTGFEFRLRAADGWRRLEGFVVTERPTKQLRVVFQAPQGFTGQVWLDDLTLMPLGEPSLILIPASVPPLREDEILDWQGLCLKLAQEAGAAEPSFGKRVWDALAPDEREAVWRSLTLPEFLTEDERQALIGDSDEELPLGEPLDERLKTKIAASLDKALDSTELRGQTASRAGAVPAEATGLLERGLRLMAKTQTRLFSRLALERRYPAEIAKCPRLFFPRRWAKAGSERDGAVSFAADYGADGPDSVKVTKTFLLPKPGEETQRNVVLEVKFQNLTRRRVTIPGYLLRGPGSLAADPSPASWKNGESVPDARERMEAATRLRASIASVSQSAVNVKAESLSSIASLEKEKREALDLGGKGVLWAGEDSRYFASILEPLAKDDPKMEITGGSARLSGLFDLSTGIEIADFPLEPGETVTHSFRLYAGPKTHKDLAAYQAHYESILGGARLLDPLSSAMTWILHAAYAVIPNYGIGIIILTILVRIAVHPLSKKSQTSMAKMQKLQPQVTQIREKFKSDKKRQQQEMMALYRQYGVNPMGGCLPMILQIPVFIGLWRALDEEISLRHAPFVSWIQDLSQPDALFGLVNVLPITSLLLMVVQQRLSPKPADPQQQSTQKIMGYLMPVFLGLILYQLASGLALYFIASTGIGLAEQRIIKRHVDAMGELKPVEQKPRKRDKKGPLRKGDKPRKRKLF